MLRAFPDRENFVLVILLVSRIQLHSASDLIQDSSIVDWCSPRHCQDCAKSEPSPCSKGVTSSPCGDLCGCCPSCVRLRELGESCESQLAVRSTSEEFLDNSTSITILATSRCASGSECKNFICRRANETSDDLFANISDGKLNTKRTHLNLMIAGREFQLIYADEALENLKMLLDSLDLSHPDSSLNASEAALLYNKFQKILEHIDINHSTGLEEQFESISPLRTNNFLNNSNTGLDESIQDLTERLKKIDRSVENIEKSMAYIFAEVSDRKLRRLKGQRSSNVRRMPKAKRFHSVDKNVIDNFHQRGGKFVDGSEDRRWRTVFPMQNDRRGWTSGPETQIPSTILSKVSKNVEGQRDFVAPLLNLRVSNNFSGEKLDEATPDRSSDARFDLFEVQTRPPEFYSSPVEPEAIFSEASRHEDERRVEEIYPEYLDYSERVESEGRRRRTRNNGSSVSHPSAGRRIDSEEEEASGENIGKRRRRGVQMVDWVRAAQEYHERLHQVRNAALGTWLASRGEFAAQDPGNVKLFTREVPSYLEKYARRGEDEDFLESTNFEEEGFLGGDANFYEADFSDNAKNVQGTFWEQHKNVEEGDGEEIFEKIGHSGGTDNLREINRMEDDSKKIVGMNLNQSSENIKKGRPLESKNYSRSIDNSDRKTKIINSDAIGEDKSTEEHFSESETNTVRRFDAPSSDIPRKFTIVATGNSTITIEDVSKNAEYDFRGEESIVDPQVEYPLEEDFDHMYDGVETEDGDFDYGHPSLAISRFLDEFDVIEGSNVEIPREDLEEAFSIRAKRNSPYFLFKIRSKPSQEVLVWPSNWKSFVDEHWKPRERQTGGASRRPYVKISKINSKLSYLETSTKNPNLDPEP